MTRKVLLLIDSLAVGGAQRQIVALAKVLKGRGHSVEILRYQPSNFFESELEREKIPTHLVNGSNRVTRGFRVASAIRKSRPEVVIAFMSQPSVLSELASLTNRNFALIVSERTGVSRAPGFSERLRYKLHQLADAVVCNAEDVLEHVCKANSKLKSKMHCIYNCVDLDTFRPADRAPDPKPTRLVTLARFYWEKNAIGLYQGLKTANQQLDQAIEIDWYGNNFFVNGTPGPFSQPFLQLLDEIERDGNTEVFRTHASQHEVIPLLQAASAVCIPSFYEGFSNVICEGLACGRPILMSAVGEYRLLVQDSVNGFSFDPNSAEDIAATLLKFHKLSADEKNQMGRESRRMAEALLSPSRFADQYEQVINQIIQ